MPTGPELLIDIYKRASICRYFENKVGSLVKSGKINYVPVYLSLGQEYIPATICSMLDWRIFPQHRGHSWYLSCGAPIDALVSELLQLPDGCCGGMGGSASIQWFPKLVGHSGLLGDQVPIAVGAAHATGDKTIVVMGDAAVEEDYVLASFGFAASKKCPVLFVVEDNDLSILTNKEVRRSWDISVAQSFGIDTVSISDDPIEIIECLQDIKLPMVLNISTCRHLWHAGYGIDGDPKWNRHELFKSYLGSVVGSKVLDVIDVESCQFVDSAWDKKIC